MRPDASALLWDARKAAGLIGLIAFEGVAGVGVSVAG